MKKLKGEIFRVKSVIRSFEKRFIAGAQKKKEIKI